MRVLVCPDKFRGTLTARQAADAIARGWRRARPSDVLVLEPLADGGEGTLDALVPDADPDPGFRRIELRATGPDGDPLDAEAGVRGRTGVVEMARASGLQLLTQARWDPCRTTSRGTGDLMRALLDQDVDRLLVGLGGSATNDGGTGMARALGIRFLDAEGEAIPEGGAALLNLARIDARGIDPRLATVDCVGLTDVDNPLCGPTGASATYGPQKGASPEDVWDLDRALGHLAAVVYRDLGLDVQHEPGAGAAGGLGFGLLAFCGASLRPGVDAVMEAVGFDDQIRGADLVVTGEGTFDEQSLHGKVPAGVMRAAELARITVAVVCGSARVHPEGVLVRSLVDRVGPDRATDDARRSVELVAEELAQDIRQDVQP
ncbi:MAG: glycerate kinase [Actinobacteria bacterium]|nr:MAG: glycerate kinase [Actinomycetota bacterium]TMK19826.1 MAG: glycerate kinase [Actinomycetota bacterium]TMK95327.1 MAG: glycerate kinase [Actinomycetota bacterium]